MKSKMLLKIKCLLLNGLEHNYIEVGSGGGNTFHNGVEAYWFHQTLECKDCGKRSIAYSRYPISKLNNKMDGNTN